MARDVKKLRIVVTAGPTREYLDPVRFLSNPSTGRMGFAVADAAARAGHEVALIAGPVSLKTPRGVRRVDVTSARDMLAAVLAALPADVVISTAAIADWRPARRAARKLKKGEMSGVLRLVRNPDVLKTVGAALRRAKAPTRLVGFAAETNDLEREAKRKCREKGLAFIVANDVTERGSGFGTDTDRVTIYRADGTSLALPLMTKRAVAARIIREL